MINTDELIKIITPWAQQLHFPVRIYLFGSRAKGTEKSGSDLDIAVEPILPDLDVISRFNMVYDIEHNLRDLLHESTGLPIHIVPFDGNSQTKKGQNIMEEGYVLYSSER